MLWQDLGHNHRREVVVARQLYLNTVLTLMTLLFFSGCATRSTSDLRRQALQINNGMTKAQVIDILGTPGNRQFHENYEAWQYKSYGMLEDDLHIVWFKDGIVTGYTTESRKDLPFGFDYKRIDWERAPDYIEEERIKIR